jgi:hypothetical protein
MGRVCPVGLSRSHGSPHSVEEEPAKQWAGKLATGLRGRLAPGLWVVILAVWPTRVDVMDRST